MKTSTSARTNYTFPDQKIPQSTAFEPRHPAFFTLSHYTSHQAPHQTSYFPSRDTPNVTPHIAPHATPKATHNTISTRRHITRHAERQTTRHTTHVMSEGICRSQDVGSSHFNLRCCLFWELALFERYSSFFCIFSTLLDQDFKQLLRSS